jgi:hypothetical protein
MCQSASFHPNWTAEQAAALYPGWLRWHAAAGGGGLDSLPRTAVFKEPHCSSDGQPGPPGTTLQDLDEDWKGSGFAGDWFADGVGTDWAAGLTVVALPDAGLPDAGLPDAGLPGTI